LSRVPQTGTVDDQIDRTPADPGDFVAALRGVLDRARSGQRVEVGCLDTSDVIIEVAGDTARLRGEVEDARAMDAVVSAAEHAAGIERVENLLHLPGEPAPNKAPSLAASHSAGAGRP